jgi:nicotinate phosphoribosyltransferase
MTESNVMPSPSNNFVRALLTDTYQLTMTYAHWKINKHNDDAGFELFFRSNPFHNGQYTIFCGLDECLKHLSTFQFTDDDIAYMKTTPSLEHCEDGFFQYLSTLSTSHLTSVHAPREGTIVFPKIPLLAVHGPLGLCQLLETTFLNLINYPSLVATNASRMVVRASPHACVEFGLRRAQGPDGAMSASKYSYVGGFVATSNVQAGKTFGIPITGTHAHAYVQSFVSLDEVSNLKLFNKNTNQDEVFLPYVLKHLERHHGQESGDGGGSNKNNNKITTNHGELASFCAYACAFPNSCLCLIDTYDTIYSGLVNFIAVAKTLDDFGYTPKGVRLDSGDLAALSLQCRHEFDMVVSDEPDRHSAFKNLTIIASNDINEETLMELDKAGHAINSFGIGTNLVTCQAQPALGCVYKLVEWKNQPRIKLSQDFPKMTIPGRKRVYRLYGKRLQQGKEGGNGVEYYMPLVDYMALANEDPPKVVTDDDDDDASGVVCRHPFNTQHRLLVKPAKVECLTELVFADGVVRTNLLDVPLSETRTYVQKQLECFPSTLTNYNDPTPYHVMVSVALYKELHEIWEREATIEQLS